MITAITPEQSTRFQEWRERWIRIGLSTEPADFEKAERAALRAYKLCGLERPEIIIRAGSPYAAILEVAKTCPKLLYQIDKHVAERVRRRVRQNVDQQILRQIHKSVQDRVLNQVWAYVWQEYLDRTLQQVGYQAFRQALQQVDEQLSRKYCYCESFGGSFGVDWCSYITFLRDVLGWKDESLEDFSIEEDLAVSCGWVCWGERVLAISDRPSKISLDKEGWLHNEQGPSIAYRDGWKLYHINGIAVPDFVVERPDKITVGHIEKEWNVEVRRIMIARMGLERFVRESGLKPVHSDDFGTLYRKEMSGDEPLVMVKVVNSTPNPNGPREEYFLRVPPHVTRAREAVAWTFGMTEEEYRPATET